MVQKSKPLPNYKYIVIFGIVFPRATDDCATRERSSVSFVNYLSNRFKQRLAAATESADTVTMWGC